MSKQSPTSSPAKQPTLKLVTCNVRYNNPADGPNRWSNRRESLVGELRRLDPDLLGTQEVLADQFDDLKQALPDYVAIGVGRDDGKRKGEFSALFIRSSRFDVLDSGTFWLSEHPEQVGSVGWDAMLTRVCTWARLRDRTANRELLVANTHFDHVGVKARTESAKLLTRKLPRLADGSPLILLGDFNSFEDSDAYKSLTAADAPIRLLDAYREVHPQRQRDEATFHDYHGIVEGSRIDWILHTADFRAKSAEIDRARGKNGTTYLSDHYLVHAELGYAVGTSD